MPKLPIPSSVVKNSKNSMPLIAYMLQGMFFNNISAIMGVPCSSNCPQDCARKA